MSCTTKITADILECSKLPTKGLKGKAWIFNADEVNFTIAKNKITAITMASGKTSFTAEGAKDFITAGHEAVVAENKLTVYKHNFSIQAFPLNATDKENLDVTDNIIVIVEANGEKGEGVFLAYGVTNGLWKTTQTKSSADNNALTTYEFSSRDQMEERYSEYVVYMSDYDSTKTALIATESAK
jgi:hypothetical protein